MLLGHCADVGRDPAEIDRSVQLPFAADQDPAQARDEAAALFDAGVDIIIFSLRPPYLAATVEALSEALR